MYVFAVVAFGAWRGARGFSCLGWVSWVVVVEEEDVGRRGMVPEFSA